MTALDIDKSAQNENRIIFRRWAFHADYTPK